MLPYWFLFFLGTFFTITHLRPVVLPIRDGIWSAQWWMIFVFLVLMIGMRHEVGTDWTTYIMHINDAKGVSIVDSLDQKDLAYFFLNWIGTFWGGIYLVNTICAVLYAWGLIVFCRSQPLPWLALTVAIPFLVIVVAMGVTRQGTAIGIAMLALVELGKGRVLRFALWIALAALFHKSAIILVPLAVLADTKHKFWSVVWVSITVVLLFILLVQDALDNLLYLYMGRKMESSGAAIRVIMNALPALIFLLFRHKFALPRLQQRFWTWLSLSALLLVVVLSVSPSSAAVDRIALYWIPLQLFVLSRLPIAFGNRPGNKNIWIGLVLVYSASVMFVWLTFAAHAYAWLPYQWYPLVFL